MASYRRGNISRLAVKTVVDMVKAEHIGIRLATIVGGIGAGKTSLIEIIVKKGAEMGLKIVPIYEPINKWGDALKRFYDDPVGNAYEFQTFVTATRVFACVEAYKENPDADLFIMERSILDDYLFWSLQSDKVDPTQKKMYDVWWNSLAPLIMPFNLKEAEFIYLKTSVNARMSRVANRARDGEVRDVKEDIKQRIDTRMRKALNGIPKECVEEVEKKILPVITAEEEKAPPRGVSKEYQIALEEIHDAFYQNVGRTKFPDLPVLSKTSGGVTVIEDKFADLDFRKSGREQTAVFDIIFRNIKRRWPELFEDRTEVFSISVDAKSS